MESQYGSFTRTFTLPTTVDHDNIQADYDKGVLKVKLAKKSEAKPRQIKVSVGGQKTLEGKDKDLESRNKDKDQDKGPKSVSQAA